MPFCMNCGQQLPEGAKFCFSCGTPLGNVKGDNSNQSSEMPRQETMVKCPNCGSSIGRMDATCPYCGAQITNKGVANSVKQFAEELARIEAEANEDSGAKGLMGNYMKAFGLDKVMERGYGSKTFERKLSHIKAFPIPNTVEEISEFILMAAASINVEFGKKSLKNTMWGKPGSTYYTEITLANAWVSKMQQAYNKAELSFPNDPMFPKIKSIYEDKMRELDRL
ncbi:zinc-ribbon domain-containing protein [Butyrivibrio sp. AE3006]|uniref:zinc-ribbon domain-containing protein n=1 Tax=Butyrivibrio sp. AE3006 TaxID=1280673 RepID=UPI00041B9F5C|nr:zinc-ribbon domain-containing protein [Butyrivibrio sp. AE3006]